MHHRPRKRFGQNFLHDPGSIARILAAVSAQPGESLVEIGPGRGAITTGLLRKAGRLDAVELDRDLIEPLEELCKGLGGLRVHQADALKFDFCALAAGRALRVVGNLPYNISTPLLFQLIDQSRCIRDMHFLLQREVVERMAARPGGRTYGRLSVMVQSRCAVQSLFTIGPGAFQPAPKVNSAFVRVVPYAEPRYEAGDCVAFRRVVALAFSQRRKTLRNALKQVFSERDIAACGVDPSSRAEQLGIEDFVRLAAAAPTD